MKFHHRGRRLSLPKSEPTWNNEWNEWNLTTPKIDLFRKNLPTSSLRQPTFAFAHSDVILHLSRGKLAVFASFFGRQHNSVWSEHSAVRSTDHSIANTFHLQEGWLSVLTKPWNLLTGHTVYIVCYLLSVPECLQHEENKRKFPCQMSGFSFSVIQSSEYASHPTYVLVDTFLICSLLL